MWGSSELNFPKLYKSQMLIIVIRFRKSGIILFKRTLPVLDLAWTAAANYSLSRRGTKSYTCLNVSDQKGRCAHIVDGNVEKALDFLLMKVHGDQMLKARLDHHVSQKLGHKAAATAEYFA